MALLDKHELKFNIHKDAKSLIEVIEKRFGGFKSLSANWKFLRNKVDLEDQSLDDLFNNLKIYEAEVKSSSSTSHNTQNIVFVSSQNTDSTNESVSAIPSVYAASTKAPASILPNVDNLNDDDLEEMDLKWQMAMLTMRARRFLQRTGRNLGANETTAIGFDVSKVECYNCHWKGHFSRECRSPRDTMNKDTQRRTILADEEPTNYALMAFTSSSSSSSLGFDSEAKKERDELKLTLEKFQTSSKNLSKLLESQITDKTILGYDSQVFNSTVFDCDELNSSESDESVPTSPVHDRYKSSEGYHVVPPPYTGTFMPSKPDLVFHDVPTASETVPNVFNVEPSTTKPTKEISQSNRPFVLIIKDWVSDSEDESDGEPMPTQIEPSFVQTSEHVKNPRTSVKPVEHPTQAENLRKDIPKTRDPSQSWLRSQKTLSFLFDVQGNPQQAFKDIEINRGYVTFGGNPKGGKITGKGKIKTGKLDFDDVNFVKELKFNLFSVSHMCDKKNNVLFTNTECVVLSFDFKLPDENHVLLRVPRENNMYNVDLKNVVPSGDLTCLFAKATLDESNLWHRRLCHINFKTMNKLVKGIKREFSVARTPQQNGVAERKNMTLIEAARNMLADLLLHIPFWAEAVNTACYVQNKVLVTKPHNKTPYELLLGKFNGKANEGFLVGYSVNSKAFRVFNSRTSIVQETLHITFLENQPDVAGSGPTWLFGIDTLTQSMNYQPVIAGNQPNHNEGIQGNFDAGKVVKEVVSAQQYVLLPLWSTGSKDLQNTDADDAFDVKENEFEVHVSPSSSDKTKKHDAKTKTEAKGKINSTNRVNASSTLVTAVGPNLTNSTNSFNAASPFDNVVSPTFEIGGKSLFVNPSQYHDDPDMPALEDIVYSDDEEDVGVEANFSNLETSITVSPIPTTRVHKDHHVTQIISDLTSAPQTRSMARMVKEQEFKDPDYPDKVYKVVKALYGLHQAPRAWYETLANYLLKNGFKEERQIRPCSSKGKKDKFQMSSMGELTFFLGLQVKQKDDEIFISQDKYVAEILRKFGLTDAKSASTPIDTEKPLLKDPDGEDVDVHIYRYLKGKPHLGLWYPKYSPFNLVAYSDSDYVGASLDRKSTTGGCQFLDDADGVECMPTEEIFAELACMGYEKPPPKLTFYKAFFSAQWKFLIHTIVQCMSAKRTAWNEFSSSMAPAVICLATESSMTLLNKLIETCATPTQKVTHLGQDKVAQALEITKLKQRVRKLEKKRRFKHSGLKRRMHPNKGEITKLDADEDVTLVDVDTAVEMDADTQGRWKMMLMLSRKLMLLSLQSLMMKMERQEKEDLEKAKVLQQQYDQEENIDWNVVVEQMQEKHLDNIKKYQSLKRKPIYVAQARKNMNVYLKNMPGYKIQHFKEPAKKRHAKETLLQESFKRLRAEVEVSGSHSTQQQETPTVDLARISKEDVQNMLQIIPMVEFKVKALQVKGKIDQTLFIKRQKGDILLVKIYVDDIIFGSTNKDLCKSFEKLMKDKFQMSSMGELTFFLGLQVKQKKDGIFISQDKYIAEILRKFGLTEGKLARTLIDTKKPLLKDPDGLLTKAFDVGRFQYLVASIGLLNP
nr:uncharacterized mitochondrial protein AtMg00810-like [Tanacetum cinerariifolium]